MNARASARRRSPVLTGLPRCVASSARACRSSAAERRVARRSASIQRSSSRLGGGRRERCASSGARRACEAINARWLAWPVSVWRSSSRQAWATASKCALKLPLSTVDTYMGSIGKAVWVSYQFMKWPR